MNYNAFLILIVIVAIFLILIIMVQNPKGGGLSAALGGGSQGLSGGVQNTNKFLDRATWTLAISLFALILLSNFAIPRDNANTESRIKNTIEGVQVTKPVTPDAPVNDAPVTTDKKPKGTDK